MNVYFSAETVRDAGGNVGVLIVVNVNGFKHRVTLPEARELAGRLNAALADADKIIAAWRPAVPA